MELDKAMTDFLQAQGVFYKMFDVIRLVEQDGHYICKCMSDGSCTITNESCFTFWGRNHRCSNCVSRQAYDENRQHVKFEHAHGRYYFVVARPVVLEGQRYALECVMDVTEQFTQYDPGESNFVMNLIHELERVSSRDPFTGLYNKKYLLDNLTRSLKNVQTRPREPLYLALWDIDSFKQINDTYGHDIGDKVLLRVANALKQGLSPEDGWAARFGGDEFAIVFKAKERDKCESILSSIKEVIDSQPHKFTFCNDQLCFKVSVSYGLAEVSQAQDAAAAIRLADKPLYQHKRTIHQSAN